MPCDTTGTFFALCIFTLCIRTSSVAEVHYPSHEEDAGLTWVSLVQLRRSIPSIFSAIMIDCTRDACGGLRPWMGRPLPPTARTSSRQRSKAEAKCTTSPTSSTCRKLHCFIRKRGC
ncbi:hypothetical protein B0T22DRAFT_451651 [Podospora appendiculata]|uniref:Secreted protein n=1 Tax=Podospora appendiculata TaxID=314037 RepID=A0AAE0XJ17_9PEZI|nr:hypothetical protein B0T22DRAFT_451651 [Podospora appendiculata]